MDVSMRERITEAPRPLTHLKLCLVMATSADLPFGPTIGSSGSRSNWMAWSVEAVDTGALHWRRVRENEGEKQGVRMKCAAGQS